MIPANPVPTALEKEAASRGLPPPQVVPNEPFANPFHKSADLPNRLAEEFKKSKVSVVVPGGEYKRRELTQSMGPNRFRYGMGMEMRHTGGLEVHLSWGVLDGVRHSDLYVRIGDEVKIYKKNTAERLVMFKVSEAVLVQVFPQGRILC